MLENEITEQRIVVRLAEKWMTQNLNVGDSDLKAS